MAKILLVEDDKSLREIYGVRLLAEGYDIVSAGDGEEALAVAIRERPDLIISDVMMPKISGFEMLDLLRGNDATKDIKVIMMTALSSDTQRERGENLGADRYLVKSQVGIEDVVRTVHEVLGDSGSQSQPAPAAPSAPAPNQSPVNPPAATAPDVVAGVPAPAMPAEPMSVPPVSNPPADTPSLPPVAPPGDDSSSTTTAAPTTSSTDATSTDTSPAATPTAKEPESFQPTDSDAKDDKPVSDEHKPSVDLTQSGASLGTRVIQPTGEGVSPKVNLDNLLANEEAKSMGLNPNDLVAGAEISGDNVTVKTAEAAVAASPPLDEAAAHAQLVEAAEAAIPPVGDNNTIVFPTQQ